MQYCLKTMRDWQKSDHTPRKIGVLLFQRFSNHCLANAVEPLRAANTLIGRRVYDWAYLSMDGRAVTSSSGLPVAVGAALSAGGGGEALWLLPSYGYRDFATPASSRALRTAATRYRVVVGMDAGSWLLAAAGLLNARRATIHWDEHDAFHEAFPEVDVRRSRFEIDGERWTCGGAMTAFELVLHMIGQHHGEALRLEVAALFMASHGGAAAGGQGLRARSGQVAAALELMRERLEEPLSIPALGRALGMSGRRLEALFRADLGAGPARVYRRIRLLAARRYVEQTGLSVAEISLRCGYADPAAMTRAFGAEFGVTPRELRRVGGV
jgi:transcriptional regulator GlxA family with amidase domain